MFYYVCLETNFGELNNSHIGRLCPKKRVSVVTVRKKMVLKGQRAFNTTLFDFAGTCRCVRNLF